MSRLRTRVDRLAGGPLSDDECRCVPQRAFVVLSTDGAGGQPDPDPPPCSRCGGRLAVCLLEIEEVVVSTFEEARAPLPEHRP